LAEATPNDHNTSYKHKWIKEYWSAVAWRLGELNGFGRLAESFFVFLFGFERRTNVPTSAIAIIDNDD